MKTTVLCALMMIMSMAEAKPLVNAEVYLGIHGKPTIVKEKVCTADLSKCEENEYRFNEQAQLLSEILMVNSSDAAHKTVYEYDKEGRSTGSKHYSGGKLHSESRVTAFNKNRQALEMKYRNLVQPNNNALILFAYNDSGQLLTMERKKWNHSVEYKRVLIYEEGKHVVEENHYGNVVTKLLYTYNDKGFKSGEIRVSATGDEKVVNYSYLYDELGNWVEKKAKQHGELTEVTKREIEYYP